MQPVKQPNFDKEVLEPLRAAQAEAAAKEAARLAKIKSDCDAVGGTLDGEVCVTPPPVSEATTVAVYSSDTTSAWAQLRNCEAGGDYAKNTGNGYYGAYQYNLSTWNNYDGYVRPDLAPPSVQDAKALETYSQRGAEPWPVCGRFLSGST